ncbi:2,3-diaminopropionate biosynthesis protein SbnB [Amycolatopsis coloradensis]|uniref:2,3-diaminopropionate biosynthesis protein SbnB n=1 Tax=Amycolatopsis coloradensis TaxID=76021 RepID=A0A1R0KQP6_9PSEU|nr:2,3-diaminopropionate biosynthesis protein SbnB [Amycolatopsis coloradensis]OLZ50007.1 2,3-diaminopropionate biosynthesis protein SbnB [Amycolatopsis coloradensis]
MSETVTAPSFAVISGAQVQRALSGNEKRVVELVEAAYRTHGAGDTVNPPSYFLRFPDRPSARIIALPASLGGTARVDGLKWISSFPTNVSAGLPRASGVLVLNDHLTGYPFACLETSIISAARTAASAALAADWLTRGRDRPRRLGFIGTGLIARYVHTYLAGTDWSFDSVAVHDLSAEHAEGFRGYLAGAAPDVEVTVASSAEDLIRDSDVVVFTTTAGKPHVLDPELFSHNPLVLHLSLRDLSPEIILSATNVLDDVEHCLKADTSPHLAEQASGNRDFVHATLCQVMNGQAELPADRPIVFSPFGLGVLDLAVGLHVHDEVRVAGELAVVEDFFHELSRYGKRAPRADRS